MILKFNQFISENNTNATTNSVNGMGQTTLPNSSSKGSGDSPFPLSPILQFDIFIKSIKKKLNKKIPVVEKLSFFPVNHVFNENLTTKI